MAILEILFHYAKVYGRNYLSGGAKHSKVALVPGALRSERRSAVLYSDARVCIASYTEDELYHVAACDTLTPSTFCNFRGGYLRLQSRRYEHFDVPASSMQICNSYNS